MLPQMPISLCQPTLVPNPSWKQAPKKSIHSPHTRDMLPGLRFHNRSCSSAVCLPTLGSAMWGPALFLIYFFIPSLISGCLRSYCSAGSSHVQSCYRSFFPSFLFSSNQSPRKWTPDFSPGLQSLLSSSGTSHSKGSDSLTFNQAWPCLFVTFPLDHKKAKSENYKSELKIVKFWSSSGHS